MSVSPSALRILIITLVKVLALGSLFFILNGCANTSLSHLNRPQGKDINIQLIEDSNSGHIELILEPLPVWDDSELGLPQTHTVDDFSLSFRHRPSDWLDKPWVRLGLFWNSRQKHVILLVAVTGPPVTIRKAQIQADKYKKLLKVAQSFKFTPAKGPFDKNISSMVFALNFDDLAKLTNADSPRVIIQTNRGALVTNLSGVTDFSNQSLKESARFQFALFNQKMIAYQLAQNQS